MFEKKVGSSGDSKSGPDLLRAYLGHSNDLLKGRHDVQHKVIILATLSLNDTGTTTLY